MSKKGFSVLPDPIKNTFLKLIDGPINFIAKFNIHPNFFTVLGLIITAVGAYFYATMHIRLGGLFIILGGICDIIDGKVARESGRASNFGAVLDSSLDRYSEFIMFFGVGIYFLRQEDLDILFGGVHSMTETFTSPVVIAFIALGGSMMVSYVRARAEGLGYDCKVGLMQRPERIVFIALGSLIHNIALIVALWIVAILANFTAAQRMAYVRKMEKAEVSNDSLDESLGI